MNPHSIKTDNAHIEAKRNLRREAITGIDEVKVLDLFAGNNILWSDFDLKKYYGIEMVKGKGRNLNADNLKVIPSLDLSQFNVIDCDSYGIPARQIKALYDNGSMQPGTKVIYTCIGNGLSSIDKSIIELFNLKSMYKKVKVPFNKRGSEFFDGMLYMYGIREVREFTDDSGSFNKRYGYFEVK